VFVIISVVAVVIAFAIAIVLVVAATKPDTFKVQRTAVIRAPADRVFALIDNFHQWAHWSPWEHRTPR
jgi:hypothetical protein